MQQLEVESAGSPMRRLLGDDRPQDIVKIVGAVVGFTILDRLISAASSLEADDGEQAVLIAAATLRNLLPTIALIVVVGVVVAMGGPRARAGWRSMDQGEVWRWMVIPWITTLAWYATTADYNFMLGQWHTFDRLLIVAMAVAAVAHPLLLVPFVFQLQVVASQHQLTFGSSPSAGVDRLAVVAILVVATTFLFVVASGEDDTSPGLLLLGMAVAAHFFAPGRTKIAIDWLTANELFHFAHSSYTTGWRGDGDGSWADTVASVLRTFKWPVMIGTLVIEVGAAISVFHRKLLRWFLPGWILLHVGIFITSGFWLFAWVLVELGLLIVLWRPDLRAWAARNDTVARGAIAVFVVGIGWSLFSPPRLAWLDAPVSYGYEIEAIGESGATFHVPLDEFGPLQGDFSFLFAQFTADRLVVRGYGAVDLPGLHDRLKAVEDIDELRAIERSFDPVPDSVRSTSERIVTRWVDRVNDAGAEPWFLISPPSRYWVDRPAPVYDRSERIESVEVVLVRSVHDVGPSFERETVLRVEVDSSGRAVVVERAGEIPDE
ncbi:MAG: hypothetical protein HKN41_12600 [Ilumatobacter sp.]|nr:hypothetical protein [Ilumatobacter sp.]